MAMRPYGEATCGPRLLQGETQEVVKDSVAGIGEYGLGMKLDAFHNVGPVTDAHDLTVIRPR